MNLITAFVLRIILCTSAVHYSTYSFDVSDSYTSAVCIFYALLLRIHYTRMLYIHYVYRLPYIWIMHQFFALSSEFCSKSARLNVNAICTIMLLMYGTLNQTFVTVRLKKRTLD